MGKKIITFAKILMILEIIVLAAVLHFGIGNQLGTETFVIYITIGIVVCILTYLPLYWFGCMFMRVESIEEQVEYLASVISKQELEMMKNNKP